MDTQQKFLRQPIISILGHVDHGKTSLLDFIRSSNMIHKEAGGITQHIGATEVPKSELCEIVNGTIKPENIKIPGLLFIDTPGHKAFTTLRKRGGSICDIAILVVDINEGFKPQTIESIEILKNSKTPFIIAANKIDLIHCWNSKSNPKLLKNIEAQREETIYKLEENLYKIVAKVGEYGISSDRFDRVEDFTKNIAIIPISAKTGEGICELLSTVVGLTQKFLSDKLEIKKTNRGFGTILEIKDRIGVGKTYDVILYDGKIQEGDQVLVIDENLEFQKSYVKAILKPGKLAEIRDKSTKFENIKEVFCARGIKLVCPNLENIKPGSPIITLRKDSSEELVEKYSRKLIEENSEDTIKLSKQGILIRADSIGSLEALSNILEEHKISIRKAHVGKLTKTDILDSNVEGQINKQNTLILNFSQQIDEEILNLANEYKIKILSNDIIYKLVDEAKIYLEEKEKRLETEKLSEIVMPFCCEILHNCIFKNSKPAIVGVEVKQGDMKTNQELINEKGEKVGQIKQIKDKNENLKISKQGSQVAISVDKLVVGKTGDVGTKFYSLMSGHNFKKLKEIKDKLKPEEIECLKSLAEIMRKKDQYWGK